LTGKRVVFMTAEGPIMTSFSDKIDALFMNTFPGETYGRSIWKTVFGEVNPSAKLTFTMPNKDNV